MHHKTRTTLTFVAALAACIAAAMPAGALAAKSAKTKVTIKGPNGDFFGKVKSKKGACVDGREVLVLRVEGSKPKPSSDEVVASDNADAEGDWSVGQPGVGNGSYYAYAPRVAGCKAGTSREIKVRR